jgi:hypothetical protein
MQEGSHVPLMNLQMTGPRFLSEAPSRWANECLRCIM